MSEYRERVSQNNDKQPRVTLRDIKESYPPEKREFESRAIWIALVLRPLSFYATLPFAYWGVSANVVTYVSLFFLLSGCGLLAYGQFLASIAGAFLINVWFLLDCVDGNLARYYSRGRNPTAQDSWYGKFIDDLGIILFRGCLFISVGIGFFRFPDGRLVQLFTERWSSTFIFPQATSFLILGAASSIMLLMSLAVHHTYLEATKIIGADTFALANPQLMNGPMKYLVRIFWNLVREPNVPPLLLFAVVFRVVDVFLIYYSIAYLILFLLTVLLYVRKH